MNELTLTQAQADMRRGYLDGGPGIAVSGTVWLFAGVVAVTLSPAAAVLALLAGGAVIYPLSVLLAKMMGAPGTHSAGNPLGRLAMEGTFWLLAGIAIAYGMHVLRIEWFFPAMLLLIGGRYLTFQTLYGLRTYWILGAVLCVVGLATGLARTAVPVAAFAGGAIELVSAGVVLMQARRLRASRA